MLDAGAGVRVRWQEGYWGVVRGLEKNGFAVFDYSLVKLTVGSVFMILASLFPYVAIVLWPDRHTAGFLATLVFIHAAGAFGAWRLGFGAAASFAALLLWLYYSAQIFLYGAEFTACLVDPRNGRRAAAPKPAAQ